MWNGKFDGGIEAFKMICSVTALADKELLTLTLATQAETVHASDAIRAAPICFPEAQI
jgi:hypothetical protein